MDIQLSTIIGGLHIHIVNFWEHNSRMVRRIECYLSLGSPNQHRFVLRCAISPTVAAPMLVLWLAGTLLTLFFAWNGT